MKQRPDNKALGAADRIAGLVDSRGAQEPGVVLFDDRDGIMHRRPLDLTISMYLLTGEYIDCAVAFAML